MREDDELLGRLVEAVERSGVNAFTFAQTSGPRTTLTNPGLPGQVIDVDPPTLLVELYDRGLVTCEDSVYALVEGARSQQR